MTVGTPSVLLTSLTPFSEASRQKDENTSSVSWFRTTGSGLSAIFPASIFARSRTSLTSIRSVLPLARMDLRASFLSASLSVPF